MKELYLDTYDGYQLYVSIWDDVKDPKGVVLLAHGMAEHIARYDDFSKYLNEAGYIVVGDDERGHGHSTPTLGVVQGDSFNQTIEDKKMLCEYIAKTYALPIVLFGHSYGSFVSQGFLERHSRLIQGCVLCGTSYMKTLLMTMALGISTLMSSFIEADKPAKLIEKLSFGSYSKAFPEETPFNWLSRNMDNVKAYEADPACGMTMSMGFYQSFFSGVNKLYTDEKMATIDKNLPILIAVGEKDPVSDMSKNATRLYDFYLEKGLNVTYKVYRDDRHEILNEVDKDVVYKDMLDFIDKCF